MTRVDFYVLGNGGEDARLRAACRLVEKAWRQGHRVLVRAEDGAQAAAVDTLLWTFRQESFVPHEVAGRGQDEEAPVLIVHDPFAARPQDVVVNLGLLPVPLTSPPARIAEFVAADTESRARGRERYRGYREAACEMTTHEL